jgi:hypothetical protein
VLFFNEIASRRVYTYEEVQRQVWKERKELGSYNAGRGHVIDGQVFAVAQKEKHPGQWPTIEKVAPKVPKWGPRSSETVAYVKARAK